MAMLTTATRSQSTPASPPSAIGTARIIVACSMPVSENDFPAVAQVRNAVTSSKSPMPKRIPLVFAAPGRNCRTPKNASSAATTQA